MVAVAIAACASTALGNLRQLRNARRASSHDPLTGVLNPTGLLNAFDRSIEAAAASGRPFSVLAADLDNFKAVNDTAGHAAGDATLVQFADLLRNHMRENSVVARRGGDEFVCLLPCGSAAAATRGRQLIQEVRRLRSAPGAPAIGVSIGVSEYPTDGTTASALLRVADQRLYKSKRKGRGRITAGKH